MTVKTFLSILCLFILSACSSKKEENKKAATADSLSVPVVSQVSGIGRIEPEGGLIDLASDQGGLISKVYIKEGDSLEKGVPMISLDNRVQQSQLTEAAAKLKTQEEQLSLNKVSILEAENNLRKAETDYEKTRRLVEKNAETKQKLDDAATDLQNKKLALQNEKANLQVTNKKIDELRQQTNTAKTSASKYTVRAPVDGLILQVTAKPGAGITPGQSFAQMAPAGRLTAICEIDELFAEKIKTGQTAFIRYKGYPDTISTGSVMYAAPYLKKKSLFSDQVGEKEDRRVREVRILLDNQKLLINRQVECVINIK
jgi:HlyD family secretion protein